MYDPTDPRTHWSLATMRRVASEPSLAAAALRYANLGIPVFPCVPGGKQPLTPNGFHDATSSAALVQHWWQRNPEANIGLPTGAITGVVVVDVDIHPAGSGFAAFERARSADLSEGWGWLVRTPSGGLHAYYPATLETEQRSWQAPTAHVDFRGDGGYVIAPPSTIVIDGRPTTYAIIAVAHHAPRPIDAARLRQFLEPPRPLPPRPHLPPIGSRPDKLAGWVASRPEGGRNGGLFWAACRMAETGHDYTETLAVLGAAAHTAGLPQRETETTIQSAYRSAAHRTTPPLAAPAAPAAPQAAVSRAGPTRTSEGIGL
jgi:hypothetical protein